ncbi:MAG: DUF433 domain-containing protein [Acidobacteria bacterium]|nr:DUF433 domain-containing protein [Acidobacteriota bacterium]MBK8149724.1 DUF433 domain-containing protein [Acidobacteriota bacterium]
MTYATYNKKILKLYGTDPREVPLYGIRETARYLKLHENTLRSWIYGRSYRLDSGNSRFAEPVITLPSEKSASLSFMNLVEVYVLSAITRVHRVRFPKVRSALNFLEARFPESHPLANHQFWTDSFELFVEKSGDLICASRDGQLVMQQVIEQYLLRIDRDVDLSAMRIYPFARELSFHSTSEQPESILRNSPKNISIDPLVGFGRPTIAGTGIATNVIAGRFRAGETVEKIAKDYDLEESKVQEAINYEEPRRAA